MNTKVSSYLKSHKIIKNELGTFTIKGQAGQGGTSVVRNVTKEGDNKEYVIKFLLENTQPKATKAYKRFRQAHNIISKLESDAVLPQISLFLLKIEEDISIPYIIMPKALGGTLKDYKEKNEITFEIFEFIFTRMTYLLKEISNYKIIHRDLKPENIFILEEDDISSMVLGDFDIAKFNDNLYEKLYKTEKNERLANYLFSAPEQKEKAKKFEEITYSADLYAFGQILYWLVMGETLQGQSKINLSRRDKRFKKYEPIIDKLLQDDSEDRYQSIEEIKFVEDFHLNNEKKEQKKIDTDTVVTHANKLKIKGNLEGIGNMSGGTVNQIFYSSPLHIDDTNNLKENKDKNFQSNLEKTIDNKYTPEQMQKYLKYLHLIILNPKKSIILLILAIVFFFIYFDINNSDTKKDVEDKTITVKNSKDINFIKNVGVLNQTNITNNHLKESTKEKDFYIEIKDNDNASSIINTEFYRGVNCKDTDRYISPYDSKKERYNIQSVKIEKEGFKPLFMKHEKYGCLELEIQTDDTSPTFFCSIDCTNNINEKDCGEAYKGKKTAGCKRK